MIIGRLTRDPELKTTASGISVCQIGVATSYVYTNQQSGQKVEQTEFHNVVLWRKLGEIAAQYLKKGTQVFIEGRLQTRSWEGQDGKKNYRTEIVADNMIMLQRAGQGGSTSSTSSGSAGGSHQQSSAAPSPIAAKPSAAQLPPTDSSSAPSVEENLPTIQQGEDISVEDIPF